MDPGNECVTVTLDRLDRAEAMDVMERDEYILDERVINVGNEKMDGFLMNQMSTVKTSMAKEREW